MRCCLLTLFCFVLVCSAADLLIYNGQTGELANSFQSWSWATVNFKDSTLPPPSGDKFSIAVTCNNYQALYLHSYIRMTPLVYSNLKFLISGDATGSQPVRITIESLGNTVGSVDVSNYIAGGKLPSNKWTQVVIPLADFKTPINTEINAFQFAGASSTACGTFYLNDIALTYATPEPARAITIVVDSKSNQVPVSNLIYGANWATTPQIKANKYTVNRWGGEGITRYAWDIEVANTCYDWYFENHLQDSSAGAPFNGSSDGFVQETLDGGAIPMITVPIIGVTPKDRQPRWGYSVAKYGPQQAVDPYQPDAGNGVRPDGSLITDNDPSDTSRPVEPSYQVAWLDHLFTKFGKGSVPFFELDNEPFLWHFIHRDVHPWRLTYDELWTKTVAVASALKAAYPEAKILGPITAGFCYMMYGDVDDCKAGNDTMSHDGLPFIEWYLQQLAKHQKNTGVWLVDIIDVHAYAAAPNVAFSNMEDPFTVGARFRSTRSLWDPTYVDESYMAQKVYMIPRIQALIDKYAPQMKIAISEYAFGADDSITGALAQTMAFGIFSQQGLYMSTRWIAPVSGSKAEEAWKIFTNYDGKGASVGDISISCRGNNTDIATYGFSRKDGTMYVIVINTRQDAQIPTTVRVSGVESGTVELYGYSAKTSLSLISKTPFQFNSFFILASPWSATLAVITPA
jgi:hypothetical protein